MPFPSQPSDEALLEAWRAGDDSAFEALFRRWQNPLRRHLTRMLDDPATADDVTVDTFLRLHRHRDRWRSGMPAAALAVHDRPQPRPQQAARPATVGLDSAQRGPRPAGATAPDRRDATPGGGGLRGPAAGATGDVLAAAPRRSAGDGDRARDRRAGGYGEVPSVPWPAAAARAARRSRARGVTSWRCSM